MQNNNISIFNHDNFGEVHIVMRDGEPWFIGNNVARCLGYADVNRAVRDHCKGGCILPLPSNGGTQSMKVIPEADLYRLILRSKLPQAEAFQDWVVEEILPAIRKDGGYIKASPDDTDELIMAKAILIGDATIKRLKAQIEEDKPKVELHDRFLDEGEDISIGALAKKLAQEGLPFGQNRLFEYLRRQKVLCSKRGVNRNMPVQKYIDRGWFRVIAPPRTMMDRWKATAYVTPKGVKEISARIHELFEQRSFV